jgi:protein farnesyltransferase subunit beta
MAKLSTTLEQELYTTTIEVQDEVETVVKEIYDQILTEGSLPELLTDKHIKYLNMALGQLPYKFTGLDASQPWILYWVLNALYLLQGEVKQDQLDQAGEKIISLIHPDGGIGGGLGQIGHAAATYAAISTLVLTKNEKLWAQLDTSQFYQWLLKLKQPDGSFVMHIGGESDTRAVYCVLVIASLLDILTDELTEGTAEWLSQCQTFEGGFGGVPFDEAHGGYTFCAVAALAILGKKVLSQNVNLDKLVDWTVKKQLRLEGGFCGRSNKLVDGCYSFWVGGLTPFFDVLIGKDIVSRSQLQNYILGCCQNDKFGGLRDKPDTHPDFYHTNYTLLGLAVAQNKFYLENGDDIAYGIKSRPVDLEVNEVKKEDVLTEINPVFALPSGLPNHFHDFFKTRNYERKLGLKA